MIRVMGVHVDGSQCKLIDVEDDFDIQDWAESHRWAFDLLQIVRLELIGN